METVHKTIKRYIHTQLIRFVFKKGEGLEGGGGGGYFPPLYSKDFQSLMTQGPDLPEAYPGGNRGVRGKGKRLSHN